MPTFKYEAIDSTGNDYCSVCNAENKEMAIQNVRAKGMFVYQIRELQFSEPVADLLKLVEKNERLTQLRDRATKNLQKIKFIMGIALLNCVVSISASLFKIHYVNLISIPISLGICAYAISSLIQSQKNREEIRELNALAPKQ